MLKELQEKLKAKEEEVNQLKENPAARKAEVIVVNMLLASINFVPSTPFLTSTSPVKKPVHS